MKQCNECEKQGIVGMITFKEFRKKYFVENEKTGINKEIYNVIIHIAYDMYRLGYIYGKSDSNDIL